MGMSASMQKIRSWLFNLFTWASLPIIGIGIGWLLGLSVSPVVSIVITSVAGAAAAVIATKSGLEGRSSKIIAPDERQISISSSNTDPRPLAALVIGLALGSIVGIWVRTHDWLGVDTSMKFKEWTITGLKEDDIARRLFANEYPYTPYAEDITWMKVDASSGITTPLEAEVEMWTQLGLEKEEVARRLFEIKYPSDKNLLSSANPITSSVDSFDPAKTGLYFSAEDKQKCDDLLRYSYATDPNSVSDFREQVMESEVELFQKLAAIISDDEIFYRTLQTLCEN